MAEQLTTGQINENLKELEGWKFEDDLLSKEFKFKDFREAMSFIVRVGFEAEEHGHHPNLSNVYNTVSIGLQTHDAGNKVTQKDIDLAKAINSIG
jgi:4a-hydroxytetrahydrobiopterin dehydratase